MTKVKTLALDVEGNIFLQIVEALRSEPLQLIAYGIETGKGIVAFLCSDVGDSFLWRLVLVARYLWIHVRVPGAVTLLECLYIARAAWATPAGGIILEIGSWKGRSACCLSLIAKKRGQQMMIIDTFSGLPQTAGPYKVTGHDRHYVFEKGSFTGTLETLVNNLKCYGYAPAVDVIVGDVAEMLKFPLKSSTRLAYVFIDVDLLDSYRASAKLIAHRITAETRVHFHEGLLEPVLMLCKDKNFWQDINLPLPHVNVLEEQYGVRTLMTELSFLPY